MANYAASQSPPGMWVRALYDYDADDRTSLSFRQGDVIQVITQLESGWWDGIINNTRGWFPSNYCQLLSSDDPGYSARMNSLDSDASGTESEQGDDNWEYQNGDRRGTGASTAYTETEEEEEAAFWIPQATADGRLYYYNTLTGVATQELPLEAPTSADETGPRDRMNITAPDQTRPPPELSRGPYDTGEESASEFGDSFHRGPRQRRSYISDGASPTQSMEDLHASNYSLSSRNQSTDFQRPERGASLAPVMSATSFTTGLGPQQTNAGSQQTYYDMTSNPPLTWSRLVSNMERAVAVYRDAVNNADRTEYVRRAEDISDHLRLLLAAGSGTTDNHSGTPSIISSNKALYPHFRDMMSKFSKLVLSSHIAAADWPAPDSHSKCLQEAEGVLQGVYGYVDIARQQNGEELPRLWPGFVLGASAGGNWRGRNGSKPPAMAAASSFADDSDRNGDSTTKLDGRALEELDELRSRITLGLTRLDAQLIVRDKNISISLHETLSNQICGEAGQVVEAFRAFISAMETLDLTAIRTQETQVTTYLAQKQVLYDLIANLVVACQTVAGPLGDEWADIRGDPFETRLANVKQVSKQMETALTHVTQTLHGMLELAVNESPNKLAEAQMQGGRIRSSSRTFSTNPYMDEDTALEMRRPNTSKLQRIFGEVPEPLRQSREQEETPAFLSLDHESELAWDTKPTPPELRGGTLTALVEQLTRHNGMDPNFVETFLLTYRSFTTAQELFELLVKRFSIQPPQGISVQDAQQWATKKQSIVRVRVVNILKRWIDVFWLEPKDEASNDLLRRILTFATDHVASTNTPGHAQLKTSVEARLQGRQSGRQMLMSTDGAPVSILPKNLRKIKFLDINDLEFARQLTLSEFQLYKKILPLECLNKTWQKKVGPNDPEPAPNVKALIAHSNQLTNWVAEMILEQSDVKKRVAVIKHFVAIADKCRQMNNFSSLMSIITALGSASVHRLSRTWGQVNQRTTANLEAVRKMMSSSKNFTEYRVALHSVNPPCIPFFGVYLTDLTFIEDGIPSVIKKTNLINFAKRSKTASVIRDIQQYQNVPYQFLPVPELQTFIKDNMAKAIDVHEMYDKSLQVEPREREDEKIAR